MKRNVFSQSRPCLGKVQCFSFFFLTPSLPIFSISFSIGFSLLSVKPPPVIEERRILQTIGPGCHLLVHLPPPPCTLPTHSQREPPVKARIRGRFLSEFVAEVYPPCSVCRDLSLLTHHCIGHTEPINICLLYTSPSPRDRQKSRMPSSA